MWDVYHLWQTNDPSPMVIKKILSIIYPETILMDYPPEMVITFLVGGLYGVGLDKFMDFIKGITNGKSNG